MPDTRTIVEAYFAAWTTNQPKEAAELLADDLHFRGPNASYESAAGFLARPGRLRGHDAGRAGGRARRRRRPGRAAVRLRYARSRGDLAYLFVLPRIRGKNQLVRDLLRSNRAAEAPGEPTRVKGPAQPTSGTEGRSEAPLTMRRAAWQASHSEAYRLTFTPGDWATDQYGAVSSSTIQATESQIRIPSCSSTPPPGTTTVRPSAQSHRTASTPCAQQGDGLIQGLRFVVGRLIAPHRSPFGAATRASFSWLTCSKSRSLSRSVIACFGTGRCIPPPFP